MNINKCFKSSLPLNRVISSSHMQLPIVYFVHLAVDTTICCGWRRVCWCSWLYSKACSQEPRLHVCILFILSMYGELLNSSKGGGVGGSYLDAHCIE